MHSSTSLFLLVCITLLTLFVIHILSDRLRKKFPPLPIWRGVLWYRWKSRPSAEALTFSPFTGVLFPHKIQIRARSAWLCFILHLLFTYSMIIWNQYRHSSDGHNCPNPTAPSWCGWSSELDVINYVTILGTFFFIFLRILQTHVCYDGLALDVPEASSMAAVLVALSLSFLMQQTEKGLLFGYSLQSETLLLLMNIARRYHGYVFAFSVVFTLWYHPAEGGRQHLPGFFMIILFLLQGCLMFTTTHLNVVWRTFLEVLIVPHALLVESVHTHRGNIWRMFLSGQLIVFLTLEMNAFRFSFLTKCVLFCSVILTIYFMYSHSLRAGVNESIRIPITYYIFIVIFYFTLYIPYSVLSSMGYWPQSEVAGTLTRDMHPSLIICAIILVLTAIVLIGFIGELFERMLRSLATKAGSASDKIISIFEDPDKKLDIKKTVLPKITLGELKQHNFANDCWIAIHGIVYDVTEFVKFHPGGSAILLTYCGGDGSSGFDGVRGNQGHPRLIRERMRSLACAVLT